MGITGLGHELWIDGHDLSDDIGSVARISGGAAPLDVTGIRQLAHERRLGLRDGAIEASAHMRTDGSHAALSTLPTTPRIVTYAMGTALGAPAACIAGPQPNYDGNRGADASLAFAWGIQGSRTGLEWGELLAGRVAHSEDDETAGLDAGDPSDFGAQFWLHVHSLTGDDVTLAIQDSANGSDWLALTGGGFAEVTAAPTALRIETARDATVRQHLRVATSGTFSAVTFSVVAVRNLVAVTF